MERHNQTDPDKPLFGHGFNSYKAINPKYQSAEVYNERNKVKINSHHDFNPIVGYAHNDWLEKNFRIWFGRFIADTCLSIANSNVFFSTRSVTNKNSTTWINGFFDLRFCRFSNQNTMLIFTVFINYRFSTKI